MPIKITIAKTPQMIDEVFKIRHQVFVEEEGFFEGNPDERVYDRFDAFPTTYNLMAIKGDETIGSMRMELDSPIGFSADEYFNFRQHVPADSCLMHCGMYCMAKIHRSQRIAIDMMLMASYFAISHGVTHILTPTNPLIAELLKKIGFKVIRQEFGEEHTGSSIPLILYMDDLKDVFISFVEQNQFQGFLQNYERVFYRKGEYLMQAGEEGEHAFWIVEGIAHVKLPGTDRPVGQLKKGDIVGEFALLTDEVRSADVVAASDVVVMTLSKEVFINSVLENPERALSLIKTMAARTKEMNRMLRDKI